MGTRRHIVGLFFLIPLTVEVFLPLLKGERVEWLSMTLPMLIPVWVFYEMTVPFLQHFVSVGAALGLLVAFLTRHRIRPALIAALAVILLAAGSNGRSDLVQHGPFLTENPASLKASESIGNPRYLAGFLPLAALLNVAAMELGLMFFETLWRRGRNARTRRAKSPPP